jgi:hypothetical protein
MPTGRHKAPTLQEALAQAEPVKGLGTEPIQ